VSVANLESERPKKEWFDAQETRRTRANCAADSVHGSYGWNAVLQGS
jgi:hypothetical protein